MGANLMYGKPANIFIPVLPDILLILSILFSSSCPMSLCPVASTLAMGKKTHGVTSTRRPKRAGNVRWTSATTGQAHLITRDIEVTVSPRDEVTQKMEVLETMRLDLSIQIQSLHQLSH